MPAPCCNRQKRHERGGVVTSWLTGTVEDPWSVNRLTAPKRTDPPTFRDPVAIPTEGDVPAKLDASVSRAKWAGRPSTSGGDGAYQDGDERAADACGSKSITDARPSARLWLSLAVGTRQLTYHAMHASRVCPLAKGADRFSALKRTQVVPEFHPHPFVQGPIRIRDLFTPGRPRPSKWSEPAMADTLDAALLKSNHLLAVGRLLALGDQPSHSSPPPGSGRQSQPQNGRCGRSVHALRTADPGPSPRGRLVPGSDPIAAAVSVS